MKRSISVRSSDDSSSWLGGSGSTGSGGESGMLKSFFAIFISLLLIAKASAYWPGHAALILTRHSRAAKATDAPLLCTSNVEGSVPIATRVARCATGSVGSSAADSHTPYRVLGLG